MSELLIIGLAIVGYVYLASRLQILRLLCGSPLRPATGQIVADAEVPPGFLDQYESVAQRLVQVGFEYSHLARRKDIATNVETSHWIMVLRHPNARAFAEISVATAPDIANRIAVHFVSFYDSVDLLTRNEPYVILDQSTASVLINTHDSADLIDQWQSHVEFLKHHEQARELTGCSQFPGPEEYLHRFKGLQWRYLDELTREGVLVQQGEDYRTSMKAGLAALINLPRRQKTELSTRLARFNAQSESSDTSFGTLAAIETNAFLRQEQLIENSRFDTNTKLVLFALSVAAFSMIFGTLFSWAFLLALIPVLLFHELGHMAAMRFLGYKDLQILFMPLGAVAIGRESESYRPWKEVIVLLAGPVPGIALAFAAIFLWQDQPDWIETLVFTSLALNYFNLLPLMPLDGGRLLHLAAFSQNKVAALLFKAASSIVFALGAWLLSDSLMVILAVVMGYLCFTEISSWYSLRTYKKDYAALADIGSPIERAFTALAAKKSLFNEKYLLIRQLAPVNTFQTPGIATRLITLLVYLGLFVGPALGAYGYLYSSFDPEIAELDESMQTSDYWRTAIATEGNPDKKADLMLRGARWLDETEDTELRKNWLETAVEITAASNNEELLSQSMFDLLHFQMENNEDSKAVETYWAWLDQTDADSDYIVSATRALSWSDDAALAYPFLARSLAYAKNTGDAWDMMDVLMDLAYSHLERNQIAYADHFVAEARKVMVMDKDLATYSVSEIAGFYVAAGDIEHAVSLLKHALQAAHKENTPFRLSALYGDLGWLSLQQADVAMAKLQFAKSAEFSTLSRAQSVEGIGVLGRLLLGDEAVESLTKTDTDDWESRLVLAYQQHNWTELNRARAALTDEFGNYTETLRWYQGQTSGRKRDTSLSLRYRMIVDALQYDGAV